MKCLVVGSSHIECLRRGWLARGPQGDHEVEFLNIRVFLRDAAGDAPSADTGRKNGRYIDEGLIVAKFEELVEGADAIVFCLQGNQHNIVGLVEIEPLNKAARMIETGVEKGLRNWLGMFLRHCDGKASLLHAPPPIDSEAHIRARAGRFRELLKAHPLRKASERLELWKRQCQATEKVAANLGISVIRLPSSVLSDQGFLVEDCRGGDATHANATYGLRVMTHVMTSLDDRSRAHPYSHLVPTSYWKSAISGVPPDQVDPVVDPRFLISESDRVATAGSCFAQHISKRLREAGFRVLVTEPAREGDATSDTGDPFDFSARFGNIYTARQFLQLFDRAFGYYHPLVRDWRNPDGSYCDPFRPRIRAHGYATPEEVHADTREHLAAVRRMFLECDVLVFTLGLTECWLSRLDGAAYPMAPGVTGGQYDPAFHVFANFTVAEVRQDLEILVDRLRQVNPGARVLLTVSPVALAATREHRHVLVSTVHSKSILRAAAGETVAAHPHVEYFPSYEIITGPHANGGYYAPDRRRVTEAGVDHVMRVFMARMTEGAESLIAAADSVTAYGEMEAAADAACDEELYARDAPDPGTATPGTRSNFV